VGYRHVHGELSVSDTGLPQLHRGRSCDDTAPTRAAARRADLGNVPRRRARGIVAGDTFVLDTVGPRPLHVLFFIEHGTRRVHLAGITCVLKANWCTPSTRDISMGLDVGRFRFLIRDNATMFIAAFDTIFTSNGADVLAPAGCAPGAKLIPERFVRAAKTELLARTLLWNEYQLRSLLVEFLDHYNRHRHSLGDHPTLTRHRRHRRTPGRPNRPDPTAPHPRRSQKRLPRRGLNPSGYNRHETEQAPTRPQSRPAFTTRPAPRHHQRSPNVAIRCPAPTPKSPIFGVPNAPRYGDDLSG